MTRRDDFATMLAHGTPSRVLLDLCGCPLSGMSPEAFASLSDLFGYGNVRDADEDTRKLIKERILLALDIDTRGVGHILRPRVSQARRVSDVEAVDEWGVTRRFTGLYWDITDMPLRGASAAELERYDWPDASSIDPLEIDIIAGEARRIYNETDYVICAAHPVYGIFELGCWMCGFDDFLMKMALDADFIRRFFEIVLDYQKRVIELYYPKVAPYAHYTSSGDDFATQASTFISPAMFDELIAPYFLQRVSYTKKYCSAAFLHHSCGNVSSLIPALIECGVDILNPIQPTGDAMRPEKLKHDFGDKITFHGGFDTQRELPAGDERSVEKAVHELLDVMQPGGGYMFAAAHNLQADVPPENIVAMFRAARNWRG